jgi:hypothetical protein
MKRFSQFLALIPLAILFSCETFQEEEEVVLLPLNMTATIVQGMNTRKVIADFHYLPGSDLLDHITWSDHQTHYFEYNADGLLTVVRQVKVKEKVQDEMWFEYDGVQASRIVLVRKNLDYTYLEPVDSTCTGNIIFEYEGMNIIRETEYEVTAGASSETVVREVNYQYDANGNIVTSSTTYPGVSGNPETVTMTYDTSRHPFSGLRYYFSGESFVNNLVSKSCEADAMDYHYELRFNEYGYPETIFEKLGSSNTRIINYSYLTL